MRVAVVNVKFSPNLGDGLLAECLEAELRASTPGLQTVSIDLAGRTRYGEGGLRNRRAALAILDRLPAPLRRSAVAVMLGGIVGLRLRPVWRDILSKCDAAVLGGGNLMSDHDLNFPIKIRAALAETSHAGLPLGVFGVGVADNWSQPGQAMFQHALSRSSLVHAAVRDTRSQSIWRTRLGPAGVQEAVVCRDPAVLAALHYPAAPKDDGPRRIALGLTNPLALRYHSDLPLAADTALTEWKMALAKQLLSRGWRVSVFTNGSPEDQSYLEGLTPRLRALSSGEGPAGGSLTIEPAFETPTDLARFISGQDLVMAHRLHACICGFAYAIPTIGFSWDRKLNSFFESVGAGDRVADAGVDTVETVVAMAARALDEGIDALAHARIVAESSAQVATLAARLVSSGRQGVEPGMARGSE